MVTSSKKGSDVPVGWDGGADRGEGRERSIFSRFVIRHSTRNVHGNYKQTSQ